MAERVSFLMVVFHEEEVMRTLDNQQLHLRFQPPLFIDPRPIKHRLTSPQDKLGGAADVRGHSGPPPQNSQHVFAHL